MSKGKNKMPVPMLPAMRGKALHKYIAEKVTERLKSIGFDVSAEHPVCLAGGGKNYVDLFVSYDIHALAVEIETTPRNVLANAVKASAIGLRLWVVVPNQKTGLAVTRKLKRARLFDRGWIRILTLGQLLNFDASRILAFSRPEKSGHPINTQWRSNQQ